MAATTLASSWVHSMLMRSISNNVKVELERIPTDLVAEIPPEAIAKILELIGRLSTLIDRASAAELAIFNTYGETDEIAYKKIGGMRKTLTL